MSSFNLDDYNDVASRIAEFRQRYPEGSLRPLDPSSPYRIETIGDRTFIAVVAAAFRGPQDATPGVGMAYEPVPGSTQFTRNSELQNAETAAWGRAIVAALAADTKKGVASREEVQSRREEPSAGSDAEAIRSDIWAWGRDNNVAATDLALDFKARAKVSISSAEATFLTHYLEHLRKNGFVKGKADD